MSAIITKPGELVPPKTQEDYLLVDGSGSMSPKWRDTLKGIQAYVDVLGWENVDSFITMTIFDSQDLNYIARQCRIADWKNVMTDPPGHHGMSTPLYDAISLMGRTLRDRNPLRAVATIITDGEENASKYTDLEQAKAILNWMRAKGWQITFLGAEFNNSLQAELLGAARGEMISVSLANMTEATKALGKKRKAYELNGTPMHYTDDEQQKFGGYLGKS